MSSQARIKEIKSLLRKDSDKYLYRNLGTIAAHVKMDKASVLRLLTPCNDFEIIFNEEIYNPNSGPLFALKECIKTKEKEARILIEEEKSKRKKEKEKNLPEDKQKIKQSAKTINKRRVKNCVKHLMAIHENLDETLNRYSISLSKNDKEFITRSVNIMNNLTELIRDITKKNDYTKYDLEDKSKK